MNSEKIKRNNWYFFEKIKRSGGGEGRVESGGRRAEGGEWSELKWGEGVFLSGGYWD